MMQMLNFNEAVDLLIMLLLACLVNRQVEVIRGNRQLPFGPIFKSYSMLSYGFVLRTKDSHVEEVEKW